MDMLFLFLLDLRGLQFKSDIGESGRGGSRNFAEF